VTIANGSVAEWHQTQNETFPDQSDRTKVLNPSSVPLSALRGQLLQIVYRRNGNDTWRFNVTLTGTPKRWVSILFHSEQYPTHQDSRCRQWHCPKFCAIAEISLCHSIALSSSATALQLTYARTRRAPDLMRKCNTHWRTLDSGNRLGSFSFRDRRVWHVLDMTNTAASCSPQRLTFCERLVAATWAAIPPRQAARLAIESADALDKRLEDFPPALLAGINCLQCTLGRTRVAS